VSRVSATPVYVRAVVERGDKPAQVLDLFAEIKNQCLAKGPRLALVIAEDGEAAAELSIPDAVPLLCAPCVHAVARVAFVASSFAKHELCQFAARAAHELGIEANVFWDEAQALAWLLRDMPAPPDPHPAAAASVQ
jgi:hypothetical protein